MKKLFFALMFIPFLSFGQQSGDPAQLERNIRSWQDTNYIDTSFTFVHLAQCGENDVLFTPSPKVLVYMNRFKKSSKIVDCIHTGEAFIDGKYYRCITIYKITIQVKGYPKKD